jgi:TrmH family RNA methyltransferase
VNETQPQTPAITFALVQPAEPGNAGAAARAISVFGFENLMLIAPAYRDAARDHSFAVRSGRAVFDQARQIPLDAVDEVLGQFDEVWGTSSRDGHRRRNEPAAPAIAEYLTENRAGSRGKVLILFGTERDGLSMEWLDRCHRLLHLPTPGGSLNLSQAVNIIAYELRLQLTESSAASQPQRQPRSQTQSPHQAESTTPVTLEMRREILGRAGAMLSRLEYPTRTLSGHPPDAYLEPLRSGHYSEQQARWLMGLFTRLEKRLDRGKR